MKQALEIWSPLPPQASGIADYVFEQLEFLENDFALTLVAEDPSLIDEGLRARYRVVAPNQGERATLRLYHVGNSPLHGSIYRAACRTPGIVVLHEWNLHELLLGFAVSGTNFESYRHQMRREHGERGSVAAETVVAALGGRYWTGVFPLNAEILGHALAVVCLSRSTAAGVASRTPGTPLLHLPHHAVLRSHTTGRAEARVLLGLEERARVVLAPGLGTASKSLDIVREAVAGIGERVDHVVLVTVGGGPAEQGSEGRGKSLGRVDIETLGDALLAADVVAALRFPSRGEASGVVMRALAAGRAVVVSSGSTADEDLPKGVVARVNPGPSESRELAAVFEFLLQDLPSRVRLEDLAATLAATRGVEPLTNRLSDFIRQVAADRESLEERIRARVFRSASLPGFIQDEIEAAAFSLGLRELPRNVFERLGGL